jgi:hypothetical protein
VTYKPGGNAGVGDGGGVAVCVGVGVKVEVAVVIPAIGEVASGVSKIVGDAVMVGVAVAGMAVAVGGLLVAVGVSGVAVGSGGKVGTRVRVANAITGVGAKVHADKDNTNAKNKTACTTRLGILINSLPSNTLHSKWIVRRSVAATTSGEIIA